MTKFNNMNLIKKFFGNIALFILCPLPHWSCGASAATQRIGNGDPHRNGGSSKARSLRECSRDPAARRASTAAMPIWMCSEIARS